MKTKLNLSSVISLLIFSMAYSAPAYPNTITNPYGNTQDQVVSLCIGLRNFEKETIKTLLYCRNDDPAAEYPELCFTHYVKNINVGDSIQNFAVVKYSQFRFSAWAFTNSFGYPEKFQNNVLTYTSKRGALISGELLTDVSVNYKSLKISMDSYTTFLWRKNHTGFESYTCQNILR